MPEDCSCHFTIAHGLKIAAHFDLAWRPLLDPKGLQGVYHGSRRFFAQRKRVVRTHYQAIRSQAIYEQVQVYRVIRERIIGEPLATSDGFVAVIDFTSSKTCHVRSRRGNSQGNVPPPCAKQRCSPRCRSNSPLMTTLAAAMPVSDV